MISTDFNLNLVLLIYTGVLTGIIANTSVTSKEIENKSTTENTNLLLSLSITLGFYSTIGILVCTIIRFLGRNFNLLNLFSIFILSCLTYLLFNKQIKKLKLPFFLDIILYLWSFFIYFGLVVSIFSFYNFFKEENENLYSFLFSILFLLIPLFLTFIKEKNKYSFDFKIPQKPDTGFSSEVLKNAHIDLIKKGYVDKNQRDEIIRKNVKDLSEKVDKLSTGTPEERKKILKEIKDMVKDSNNNKKK
jgi:magnesium-transporting ATPase (P-type)